jgi:hypothetical protein
MQKRDDKPSAVEKSTAKQTSQQERRRQLMGLPFAQQVPQPMDET